MPNLIKILPEHIASKIAAGEVVQRPESVVKELIENSIDAGARSITVVVKDAGKSLLQVVDDGCGMSEQDAVMAFQRHATSKIFVYEDIENIQTLGFRGEALASVAAVAQVELKSKQAEDDTGTLVKVEAGEVKETAKAGMENGTSVSVKNLFYNTPGRRNFLKSDNTEFRHIFNTVQRVAISNPQLAVVLISDDERMLDLRPSDLDTRVKELFGERRFESLLKLREETDALSLSGYIGKPLTSRKTKGEQYLFLNGRYIINRAINHSVFNAYERLIDRGDYPLFLLFLTVDPRRVDVNVHPSKLEVKFDDERNIYSFIGSVVKRALSKHDLTPSLTMREEVNGKEVASRFFNPQQPGSERGFNVDQRHDQQLERQERLSFRRETSLPRGDTTAKLERLFGAMETGTSSTDQSFESSPVTKIRPGERQPQEFHHEPERTDVAEGKAIWQVHNKYILSQIRTGLLIIDQHVAHERILYEKALASLNTNLPFSQQLLFPHTAELSAGDYALVKELLPHLEKLGFDIKLFGKNTVVIEGVPSDVRVGNEHTILQEIIDQYKEYEQEERLEVSDNLAKSYACKAAIKAGDRLNVGEMSSLIDQLFATSMPYVCPHGRPIVTKISIEELDKRFGRT